MSQRELDRYDLIKRCLRKELTTKDVAHLLDLTTRQIRNMKRAVRTHGPEGLIHGNRGKKSNRALKEREKKKIITLLHNHYHDFGPTFAAEKLEGIHGITRDPKTIRTIMITEGLWKPKKGKNRSTHRSWRQRKAHRGELIQFDGSYHDWLEGRGGITKLCLIASIDDATGQIMHAVFGADEGVFAVFSFWKGYLERHGKPRAVYCDRFSTYRQHIATAREKEVKNQFQRAMESLTIEPIFAKSPEAKGRVERLFETLQDRLVKEMRLAGISTVEEANRFLAEVFIPWFNKRFAVEPVSTEDLHRTLTQKERKTLDSVFARQKQRTVMNDFTIAHDTIWYQLTEKQPVTVCKKDKIIAEEWVDRTIHFRLRGKELNYEILPARPKKTKKPIPWVLTTTVQEHPAPSSWKPATNHPWRRQIALAVAEKEQKNTTFLNP